MSAAIYDLEYRKTLAEIIETTETKNNDTQSKTNNSGRPTEPNKSASHSKTTSWVVNSCSLQVSLIKVKIIKAPAKISDTK